MCAAENGRGVVAQNLVAFGADLEAKATGVNGGKTALIFAAQMGNIAMTRYLIESGSNLEAKATIFTDEGKTALIFAAENGHVPVVQHLLEKGARLEVQATGIHGGKTALMWAAENDHETVMKILVYSGKPLSYAMRQPPNDDAIITELNKCSIKARPIFSGYLTGIIANIASLKALATGSTAVLDEAAYTKRVDLLKAGVYGVAFSENITERLSGMPVLKFNIMVSIMRAAKTAKLVYGINAHFLIRTLTLGPQHSMLQKAAKAFRVKAILMGYIIGETETGILMKELQAPAIKRPRHSDAAKEFLVKRQRNF